MFWDFSGFILAVSLSKYCASGLVGKRSEGHSLLPSIANWHLQFRYFGESLTVSFGVEVSHLREKV